jgi:hypothetical protein
VKLLQKFITVRPREKWAREAFQSLSGWPCTDHLALPDKAAGTRLNRIMITLKEKCF